MKKYIITLFIIGILLIILITNINLFQTTNKLYISEIMPSNTYTIKDDDLEYSDYIEIHNNYNQDINLSGFMLTDNEYKPDKWLFPDITIKKGEYLLIYVSGKNKCDLEKKICHTNFKLNSDGETVVLTDNAGNILSKVTYPKMGNDISYGTYKNKYKSMLPTPQTKNKNENIKSIDIKKYKLEITEYMTSNKNSHYLPNGAYYDWVEIYNNSDNDLDLGNIYISDDMNNLNKFRLPEVAIKKKSYLVIYLTGGECLENYICTNFKLSDQDGKLVLSNNGKVIDEVDIVSLPDNVSYGLKNDKWQYFSSPTPGFENKTQGFDKLGGNNGNT